MSYDLFLKPRSGALEANQMLDYFRDRPNYVLESRQASYGNEATGVYFHFEEPQDESDSPDGGHAVAFSVNFFRPSFFIYEAEPEVSAFVRNFDCVALDPQTNGMGEGEYRGEKLISGWRHGNAFAYQAILEREPELANDTPTLPTEQLMKIWRWNYDRNRLQEDQERDVFVPRIFVIKIDGQLATMSVWVDGIPSIMPKVDYLLVKRQKLAPRRFLRKVEDQVYLPWVEALPILESHGSPHADDAISLDYDDLPKDVSSFVSSLTPRQHTVAGVPLSEVLDRELIEGAARGH